MNICIFGASSDAIDQSYLTKLEELGATLAGRGHGLVFGGGARGVMGASARGFYKAGGYIKGVAPSFFNVDGVLFAHCNEFVYTQTMRERKQVMEDSSDAFVIAPGGIGTFEEFFEILTLKQLGRHAKPIAVYNLNGYYDDMLSMLQHSSEQNFMRGATLSLYSTFTEEAPMIAYLENTHEEPVDVLKMKVF